MAIRREALGSIHLLPQNRRNVIVVHIRPVRPEPIRVVSPHVGDDLAVERNLGGSLLRLFAVPLGTVLALAVPAVIHGEGGQVGGLGGTVDVDLRHGRTGTVLSLAVEAGGDHGHLHGLVQGRVDHHAGDDVGVRVDGVGDDAGGFGDLVQGQVVAAGDVDQHAAGALDGGLFQKG